jgi:hypothetical protein
MALTVNARGLGVPQMAGGRAVGTWRPSGPPEQAGAVGETRRGAVASFVRASRVAAGRQRDDCPDGPRRVVNAILRSDDAAPLAYSPNQ